MESQKLEIKANPSKKFFLNMLTRDITLTNCVLDLIDNSIDSIIRNTKFDPMKALLDKNNKKTLKGYKIFIKFNQKEFSIEDNSTGVSALDAEENVFRFGGNGKRKKGIGLSVYGIGMKRAFLKIGRKIKFESSTDTEKVKINIDVNKWIEIDNDKWIFEGDSYPVKSKSTGTKINITELNETVAFNFKSISFKTKLLKKISMVYGIFLLNQLEIYVNGKKTEHSIPNIAQSSKLKPSIETIKRNDVNIKIIAGISHESYKTLNGWYIFCNGRLILSGDKTELTGWGDGIRKFHASTNRFVGYVYFESKNVDNLPWMTTKDGVDYDSPLYQYALKEMKKMADPVVKFLAKQYTKKNLGAEELQNLLDDSQEISIQNLTVANQKFDAPKFEQKGNSEKSKRINYNVPESDFTKVKEIMNDDNLSNSEIGEKTFYYYLKHED